MRTTRRTAMTLAILFAASPICGATFIVPTDEQMIERSDVVISGTCINSYTRMTAPGRIETVYQIAIAESLKGEVSTSVLDLVEPGGHYENSWLVVSGAPVYEVGRHFVVFADRRPDGEWSTQDLTLGRFRFESDAFGRSYLVRDSESIRGWTAEGSPHVEQVRKASGFMNYIRDVVAGRRGSTDYLGSPVPARPMRMSDVTTSEQSPSRVTGHDFVFELAAMPARRFDASSLWFVGGGIGGLDLRSAAETAILSWTGDPASNVRYVLAESQASGTAWGDDGEDRIIAGDPDAQVLGTFPTSSVIAATFSGCTDCGNHFHNGDRYVGITFADVIINDGVSSATFSQDKLVTTIAHELGHSLGFRHSNRAPDGAECGTEWPCSSEAVMNSWVVSGLGGSLQGWDRLAVRIVYGDGASCEVEVLDQPAPITKVSRGDRARLAISVYSPVDVTYKWYEGEPGDTSRPIPASDAPYLVTQPIEGPSTYWVRISSSCGTRDSDTARVGLSGRLRGVRH